MEIVKAVVLARHDGRAAPWPTLDSRPRQLAPLANRPILFHALDRLQAAGVREVAMVVDDRTEPGIRAVLSGAPSSLLDVHYVRDHGARALVRAVTSAAQVLQPPFFLSYGDVVYHEHLGGHRRRFGEAGLDALVLRQRARNGASCDVTSGYVLGNRALAAIRRGAATGEPPGLDGVLAEIRASGARVEVAVVDACAPCRDDQDALLEANRRVLEELEPDHREARVVRSSVQGRVVIHPSATVTRSVVRGPAIVGPGAVIRDAYVGPYTSVGASVQLEGAEVEYSIILEDAQIRFLAARLESSIIGRGATIGCELTVPRSMRLSVGDHAKVLTC